MANVIYARADIPSEAIAPGTDPVMSLKEAMTAAEPGTEIRLLPGRFTKKITIRRLNGRGNAPIVIQGSLKSTLIDGQVDPVNNPADRSGLWPRVDRARLDLRHHSGRKRPFFRAESSSWIEWRDLWVENCWPYFLNFSSCHHLTVAGCRIRGGTYAIYMKDAHSPKPSHHILIENNKWCQDPTGSDDPGSSDPAGRKSWQDWTWHEMKKKPKDFPGWEDLRFMNGGFIGGNDIAGSVVVRWNEMRFAFNAIRLEISENQKLREPLRPDDQGNAPFLDPEEFKFNYTPPDLRRNTNVEIYENLFEYIRDNAIEPEYGATNWWVWNNRMDNIHKAISIHNNGGGYWYFFGNVGGMDAVPPAQINEPPVWRKNRPVRKLGGKIFKFLYGPPLPGKSCFAMHNSWRPRGGVVTGGGEMRHFKHLNNAIQHCAPVQLDADIRCPPTAAFAELFDQKNQPEKEFDYGFATRIKPLNDDARNRFDHDVSNGADFPDKPRDQNQEMGGKKAKTDVFDKNQRKHFILASDSPARGLAEPVELRGRKDWPAKENWQSTATDAGAVQPDGHFAGPSFAHCANPFYDEAPRLVAVEAHELGATLVFSVPLDPVADSIDPAQAVLILDEGTRRQAKMLSSTGRRLLFDVGGAIAVDKIAAIELPFGMSGGLGEGSLPLTPWAGRLPMSITGTAES